MKPFRFGLVAAVARSGAEWKDQARRAEDSGYSSLVMPDGSGPVLSPFSALATAAAVTTRLKVGNWVLAGDLRNPVLLAREAATLDLLSDGRLELGFGAGRGDNDYAALGLGPTPSAASRLSKLEEALQILEQLVTGETISFTTGKHYSVKGATLYPVPSKKHIPILMAAGGPRALSVAGRYADIAALASGSPKQFLEQRQRLQDAAGPRFQQIELATIVWPFPDDSPPVRQASEAMIRRLGPMDVDAMLVSKSPSVLAGSQSAMVDQLQERRETLGLSYYLVGGQAMQWFTPIVQRLSGT